MNLEQFKHVSQLIDAFESGKKLEFNSYGSIWVDFLISSGEKLMEILLSCGERYRIKHEPFKVIVDELYKFGDNNFHVDELSKIHLEYNARRKFVEAYISGKTIQFKAADKETWCDVWSMCLDSFLLYLHHANLDAIRIKPETVKLYSRCALYKFDDKYIIAIHRYSYESESAFEKHQCFVKWVEDEHEIEV